MIKNSISFYWIGVIVTIVIALIVVWFACAVIYGIAVGVFHGVIKRTYVYQYYEYRRCIMAIRKNDYTKYNVCQFILLALSGPKMAHHIFLSKLYSEFYKLSANANKQL